MLFLVSLKHHQNILLYNNHPKSPIPSSKKNQNQVLSPSKQSESLLINKNDSLQQVKLAPKAVILDDGDIEIELEGS